MATSFRPAPSGSLGPRKPEFGPDDVGNQLLDRTVRLVKGGLRHARRGRVGICDSYPPEPFAAQYPGSLVVPPVRVVEIVRPSRVPMRPAVDEDSRYVPGGIEASVPEGTGHLVPDHTLEHLE